MLAFLVVISVFIIDQLTKTFLFSIMFEGQSVTIFKNIFHITLVCNEGAAFGIFSNQTTVFIWTSIIAITLILYILVYNQKVSIRKNPIFRTSLALILGGAIGNFTDRVRYGFVIDFLDFHWWPVFNIADTAITLGSMLLLWQILKPRESKERLF